MASEPHDDAGSARRLRLAARLETLRSAVVDGNGTTDPAVRRAAFDGQAAPQPLDDYVGKVREASYRVTDADIERLRSAGFSEDAIFELTIAAAMGAAQRGLRAGLLALGESEGS
jgi:alkylhydroperoxidase family enzyme